VKADNNYAHPSPDLYSGAIPIVVSTSHMLGCRLLTLHLILLLSHILQIESLTSAYNEKGGLRKMSSLHERKLEPLIITCKEACDVMAPMILGFYNVITGATAKLKADASVFTIADGIVQHLLINHLFAGGKFNEIVGEEDDSKVNITVRPFTVDDLVVPEEFFDAIDSVRDAVTTLGSQIDGGNFKDLTIFIDPIDGTREFSTSLGEQCSVCIGFSDVHGKPVAGIVYRPLTQPPTWAAGARSENLALGHLDKAAEPNPRGLLTSNGGISPFIVELMKELDFVRVPSGGAGNKM
jgi:fructose-1,6-bisphosphatase/inositol monophosphatase family enzyme